MVGSVEWGASPRGHGGVGQQEGDGSVPECWVPCGEGNLPGALSLRYRSSDTFPLATGSSSSLRFCLWKKPSWEEGQTDRSEGQTFTKFEWLKKRPPLVMKSSEVYLHENLLCFIDFLSDTRGQQSLAIQYCLEQPARPLKGIFRTFELYCSLRTDMMIDSK